MKLDAMRRRAVLRCLAMTDQALASVEDSIRDADRLMIRLCLMASELRSRRNKYERLLRGNKGGEE